MTQKFTWQHGYNNLLATYILIFMCHATWVSLDLRILDAKLRIYLIIIRYTYIFRLLYTLLVNREYSFCHIPGRGKVVASIRIILFFIKSTNFSRECGSLRESLPSYPPTVLQTRIKL